MFLFDKQDVNIIDHVNDKRKVCKYDTYLRVRKQTAKKSDFQLRTFLSIYHPSTNPPFPLQRHPLLGKLIQALTNIKATKCQSNKSYRYENNDEDYKRIVVHDAQNVFSQN